MQQNFSIDGASLGSFLQELVQRNLDSILMADEPASNRSVDLVSNAEGLIVACSDRVNVLAWRFAASSDGRVDQEEMYSIAMLEICECVATGRLANATSPIAYLCGVARLAMVREWGRLHQHSDMSLDAPLTEDGFTLHDVLSSDDVSSDSSVMRARAVHGAVDRLTPRRRAVVRRVYGFEKYGAHTSREVASMLHVTGKSVNQLGRRAIRAMQSDAGLCQVLGVEVVQ